MRVIHFFVFTVVSAICCTSSAALIDNFTSVNVGVSQQASVIGAGSNSDTDTGLAGVIGGSRNLTINTTSGTNSSDLTVLTGPQTLNLNTGAGNNSAGTILWNANGAGLGGVDLTDAGASNKFDLEVLFADNNLGVQISVTETAGAGGSTATYSQNLGAIASSTFVGIPFASFTNFANVDFSQINSISLMLSGPASQDAIVRLVQTTGSGVPEPASIALWSVLGLAVAGFAYRFRKR